MPPLAREDPEKIAIVRNRTAGLVLWVFCGRLRDERVDRAIELVVSTVPVQAIVSAFIADQFLRKLLGDVALRMCKIVLLRLDQFAARIQGGKFIGANAAEKDLVFAGVRVEIPGAVVVNQGNRKRPVFGADHQGYRAVRLGDEAMHLLVFDNEADARIGIFRRVAGREDLLAGWAEERPKDLFGPAL